MLQEATVTREKRGNKLTSAHVSEKSQPACIKLLLILLAPKHQGSQYLSLQRCVQRSRLVSREARLSTAWMGCLKRYKPAC